MELALVVVLSLAVLVLGFKFIGRSQTDGSTVAMDSRIQPYEAFIRSASSRFSLPFLRIAAIVLTESEGRRNSLGVDGEVGLMQILPPAFADAEARWGLMFTPSQLWDPEINIIVGSAYLALLREKLNGNLDLATQAYNVGESRVRFDNTAGSSYLQRVLVNQNMMGGFFL